MDLVEAHPTNDDGDFGGDVARGVLGAEDLGSDDVADAVADEVHGCDCGLFGVAGLITR